MILKVINILFLVAAVGYGLYEVLKPARTYDTVKFRCVTEGRDIVRKADSKIIVDGSTVKYKYQGQDFVLTNVSCIFGQAVRSL